MGHALMCLPPGGRAFSLCPKCAECGDTVPNTSGEEFQLNRKVFALTLAAACLLLLASCGKQEQEQAETGWSEAQMARVIWDSQPDLACQTLLYGETDFDSYLADVYRIDPPDVAGGAVLYAGGVSAQEIAVLRLGGDADIQAAVDALENYIFAREGAFEGYAPEQYAILKQSAAAERGRYIALLICPDQNAARDAFAACFTDPPPQTSEEREPAAAAANPEPLPEPVPDPEPEPEPEREAEPQSAPEPEQESEPQPEQESEQEPEPQPAPEPEQESEPQPEQESEQEPEPQPAPEPEQESEPQPEQESEPEPEPQPQPEPESDWSYDTARIRIISAWFSGVREGLRTEDLEILSVLDQIPALTDPSLSAYDRELALHDWMLEWAEYDPGALSSGPVGDPMPHNDDPYGFLLGRKGICLGYTTTFQLFMDLCGIECLSVHGASHLGTDAHAWNLIRLEDEWYAVDVTWDDPVSATPVSNFTAHRYFNVTSDFLRENDHQWDDSAVPEAEGTAFAWAG